MTDAEFRASVAESAAAFASAWLRVAAAVEIMAESARRANPPAKSKAGSAKSTAKTVRGTVYTIDEKNNYGFYNFVVDGTKYSTKDRQIAAVAEAAFNSGQEVEISFSTNQKGKWTNYFAEQIEIIGASSSKPPEPKPQPEDDSEAPF